MMIPTKKEKLFRKYEGVIFYSKDRPKSERVYSFYLLLRPMLGWLKQELKILGLEGDEAESELYLMANELFCRFDKNKSSIVPYLQRQLPWSASNLLKLIKKRQRPILKDNTSGEQQCYYLDEEFYWRIPGILFEGRYVGKCFTRSEKYIIYIILVSDDKELTTQGLANTSKIDKRRIKEMLLDLGAELNWRKFYER